MQVRFTKDIAGPVDRDGDQFILASKGDLGESIDPTNCSWFVRVHLSNGSVIGCKEDEVEFITPLTDLANLVKEICS